jgi:hypothetical protein
MEIDTASIVKTIVSEYLDERTFERSVNLRCWGNINPRQNEKRIRVCNSKGVYLYIIDNKLSDDSFVEEIAVTSVSAAALMVWDWSNCVRYLELRNNATG